MKNLASYLKFRVLDVDMNGFNGREHHPAKSDKGLVVTPVKMEAYHTDASGFEEPVLDKDGTAFAPALETIRRQHDKREDQVWESVFWSWTCVTENGRVLDLMDFELEVVVE